jgi:hypothetical protein
MRWVLHQQQRESAVPSSVHAEAVVRVEAGVDAGKHQCLRVPRVSRKQY